MTTNPKPIQKISIGSVTASIWHNTKDGGSYYNTTIDHRFKASDGWMKSSHYRANELLNLAKVALLAHSEVSKLIYAQTAESCEPGLPPDA